jgi:hypothetical protein
LPTGDCTAITEREFTPSRDGAYDPGLRPFRAELIHWINSGTPFTPPLPVCHHRTPGHRDHPDPQEQSDLEGRLPGSTGPKRNPARHPALWPGLLEALDRLSRSKPDRGEDVLPQGIRRTHREPRGPDRQTTKIHIRIALMNRFSALGTAAIVRVA